MVADVLHSCHRCHFLSLFDRHPAGSTHLSASVAAAASEAAAASAAASAATSAAATAAAAALFRVASNLWIAEASAVELLPEEK